MLLSELDRDNRLRWAEAVHRHNISVLQIPDVTDDAFRGARDAASSNLTTIKDSLFPHEAKKAEKTRDVSTWRQMYVSAFGDWQTDPVAKANLDALVSRLEKRMAEGLAASRRMSGQARRA